MPSVELIVPENFDIDTLLFEHPPPFDVTPRKKSHIQCLVHQITALEARKSKKRMSDQQEFEIMKLVLALFWISLTLTCMKI